MNPAINLTIVAGTIMQAFTSLDRILEISRAAAGSPQERRTPMNWPQVEGDIRLEAVDFAYEPETPLFQKFSLHMPAGKMTALVGHTGCGKTTITSLLLRLWEVQGGQVTLDGHDIRLLTLRNLRSHMGVVTQESIIFEASIRNNIAYAHARRHAGAGGRGGARGADSRGHHGAARGL